MNRFRRKSDAKHPHLPPPSFSPGLLPDLPPVNDFRTSLILPDLSRRFSVLRTPAGEPVSLDHIKSRLADKRSRGGADTHITEEEEDMLLETLGQLRSKLVRTSQPSQDSLNDSNDPSNSSSKPSDTSTSSLTSSPSTRSTKRYSNNLFGSGRLRDYAYLRNTSPSKGSTNSSHTTSLTPTEASVKNSISSLRPSTPDHSTTTSSPPSTPNDRLVTTPSPTPSDPQMQTFADAETQLQKTLGPTALKRASLAVGAVIKELEDEADDEILLPRTPVHRHISLASDQPSIDARDYNASTGSTSGLSSHFEAGMAISSDHPAPVDVFSDRQASPVPPRPIPGYVPGMVRPMTPRGFELDDVRSHSTTPRAKSPDADPSTSTTGGLFSQPQLPGIGGVGPTISSFKPRRDSVSSLAKPSTPVPAAPLFLQRSTNGRFTPTLDDSHRSGGLADLGTEDNSGPLTLAMLTRRRPASPLAGPPFQPLTASTSSSSGRPPSRPSTPSNIIWNPNPNPNGVANGRHSRNGSWTGENLLNDLQASINNQNKTGGRNLWSPPPMDPSLDSGTQGTPSPFSSASTANSAKDASARVGSPGPYLPSAEPASPLQNSFYAQRSPTPTQQRSPVGSPFSSPFANYEFRNGATKRSSRQNPPSSPFGTSVFPNLGSLPLGNSSRSSFESAGSSFHSWDEPDQVLNVFSEVGKEQPTAWHDFDTDRSSTTTLAGDEDESDAEEIVMRYAGLKQADIVTIQDKLVAAAVIRASDNRDRPQSSLRRRRPSTSQSNYSRIASPPPQSQPPAPYTPEDQYTSAKTNIQLNSVVENIKDHQLLPPPPPPLNTALPLGSPPDDGGVSPATRRNRDLAQVLFGDEDNTIKVGDPKTVAAGATNGAETADLCKENDPITPSTPNTPIPTSVPRSVPKAIPAAEDPKAAQPPTSPYLLTRNPSTHRIPQTPQEQAELAREVQRKTEAATLALKKAPSKTDLHEGLKHSTSIRKRIDPSQISTPRLVSASTSVDAIPLRSPSLSANNNNGASKLGSRFKKLRGSLRVKNPVPSGEEVVPTPETVKTPPATQTAQYDPAAVNGPGTPALSSADSGRFKVPVPNTPTTTSSSAGPGFKGFMARFRNKQRMSEMPTSNPSNNGNNAVDKNPRPPISPSPLSPTTPITPRPGESSRLSMDRPMTPRTGQRPMYSRFPPANLSATGGSANTSSSRPTTPVSPLPAPSSSSANATTNPPTASATARPNPPTKPSVDLTHSQSAAALEQLFAAATNLGLDQKALHQLLENSASTPVKATLQRTASSAGTSSGKAFTAPSDRPQPVSYVGSTSSDQTATPGVYQGSSVASSGNGNNLKPASPDPSEDVTITRKLSTSRRGGGTQTPEPQRRPPKEGAGLDPGSNTIVRRTLICPNDFNVASAEVQGMMQRKNSARRRRVSGQSLLQSPIRPVQDRVPTPPPSKVPAAKRFSSDMPPMPQLPGSRGVNGTADGSGRLLTVPSTPTSVRDKANSAHDSFYDMYAEESSRAASMAMLDSSGIPSEHPNLKGEGMSVPDSGPFIEVIELANGETVWNIVNGLRDYDEESIYTGRTSFASEYSTGGPGITGSRTEPLHLFPKDHTRSGSKGSISSFASKKKPQQGKIRPETKVYYSSSAQIGRLIENLSQGADAGSFNFQPNSSSGPSKPGRPGHSASSSLSTNDMNWTVEERLDRMLGAMNSGNAS